MNPVKDNNKKINEKNENINKIDDDFLFTCSLKDFDGPLDVLLTLIQKKKMNIEDLDLIELATQYSEFIKLHENDLDVDEFSDYTLMATQLIELKTRFLLPDLSKDDLLNIKDFEKERANLIQRLIEYKMYKDTLPYLLEYKLNRSIMYEKNPEDYDDYFLDEIPMGKLPKRISVDKLKRLFEEAVKIGVEKSLVFKKVSVPEVSITLVQRDLIQALEDNHNKLKLFDYFKHLSPDQHTLEYFCTLFLAMLILIKREWIFLENKHEELQPEEYYLILNNKHNLEDLDEINHLATHETN